MIIIRLRYPYAVLYMMLFFPISEWVSDTPDFNCLNERCLYMYRYVISYFKSVSWVFLFIFREQPINSDRLQNVLKESEFGRNIVVEQLMVAPQEVHIMKDKLF